jgi:type IV pilus assembly protein PilM
MHMPPAFFCSCAAILECGSHRTTLSVFQRSRTGRLELLSHVIENLPVESDGEKAWLAHTATALRALKPKAGRTGPVTILLPAHLALTKLLKTPPVETAKRARIIRFEAQEAIPYALEEVAWHHATLRTDESGCDVLLAAAKLEMLVPLCDAVASAGFEPDQILPAAVTTLAVSRLARTDETGPTLYANLGVRSGVLILREGERLQLRTLSFVSNFVADPTSSNFGSAARKEELSSGGCDRAAPDSAADNLAAKLSQEISLSLLHFQRQSPGAQPVRITVAGAAGQQPGFKENLAARTGLPVTKLVLSEAANSQDEWAEKNPDLVGAAAVRLLPGQVSLNLLPANRRVRREFRRRQPWLAIAASLAVVALVAPIAQTRSAITQLRRQITRAERELAPIRATKARLDENARQLATIQAQLASLQRAQDCRASWLGLLADLQTRLGAVEDVWLDRMEVVPPAQIPTKAKLLPVPPLRLAISGRILEQPIRHGSESGGAAARLKALMTSLDGSPFVATVDDERFDHSQPGLLRFEFILGSKPGQPL